MTDHRAVVPVKGLRESKKRLASHLSQDNREILVKALLEDVLSSLGRADIFSNISVISQDQHVMDQIRWPKVVLIKQNGTGLNAAVQQSISSVTKACADSLTIVLADIPLAQPADFREMLQVGAHGPKVVLVPSMKGGTNIMTLSPSDAISPSYGRWSYSRHLRQAQKKGLSVYSISNPRVSFDIDTPRDLSELHSRDPDGRTSTGRVAARMLRIPALSQKRP
ncbi:MAG TPA: 2-phospho-L-lactate guanylyltransferase [Candidatus Bathyarchaeia archaeon]|nr:2-phospho-L-lactate guanylyltransferase [Candidatus Bathyarchaeia archaeon]